MTKTALFAFLTIMRKWEIKRESNDILCIFCSLQQIVDLDEKNQILTSNIWLNLDWVDYSLVWNASEYGGVKVGMVIQFPLQYLVSYLTIISLLSYLLFWISVFFQPLHLIFLFFIPDPALLRCCLAELLNVSTQMLNSWCASNVYKKLAVYPAADIASR
jgi:hypothetical protein